MRRSPAVRLPAAFALSGHLCQLQLRGLGTVAGMSGWRSPWPWWRHNSTSPQTEDCQGWSGEDGRDSPRSTQTDDSSSQEGCAEFFTVSEDEEKSDGASMRLTNMAAAVLSAGPAPLLGDSFWDRCVLVPQVVQQLVEMPSSSLAVLAGDFGDKYGDGKGDRDLNRDRDGDHDLLSPTCNHGVRDRERNLKEDWFQCWREWRPRPKFRDTHHFDAHTGYFGDSQPGGCPSRRSIKFMG